MYARLVGPRKMRLTSDDMPFGALCHLSEGGYRLAPYLLLVPRWRVRWPLLCFDVNRVEPDGSVFDRIDMRLLGFPVATLEMRVTVDR